MNLQAHLLALEIQKTDLTTEAITAAIENRLKKLNPPSFDQEDIEALLIEVGETQPKQFAIGLTQYIEDCCSYSEKGNLMDFEVFKEYIEAYKNDQE